MSRDMNIKRITVAAFEEAGWGLGVGTKDNLNHSYKFWISLQKDCIPVLSILLKSNKIF